MNNGQIVFEHAHPNHTRIIFTFECYRCGAKQEQESLGEYIMWPRQPEGWTRINDGWFCAAHELTITDKAAAAV